MAIVGAIRNAMAIWDADLQLADQPGVDRPGLGMHANQGITYDLDALRAVGHQLLRVEGVAGMNYTSYSASAADVEVFILVDGVERYRRVFYGTQEPRCEAFSVTLGSEDRFLTVAVTDEKA